MLRMVRIFIEKQEEQIYRTICANQNTLFNVAFSTSCVQLSNNRVDLVWLF